MKHGIIITCYFLLALPLLRYSEPVKVNMKRAEIVISNETLSRNEIKAGSFRVIVSDSDGNIYLLSSSPPVVYQFTKEGAFRWKRNIEQEFNRPGKIRTLDSLKISKDNKLYFLSRYNKELFITDRDFKTKKTIKLQREPYSFTVDSRGYIHVAGFKRGETDKAIYTYSPEGKLIRKFGKNVSPEYKSYNKRLYESVLLSDSDDNLYHFLAYYQLIRKYSKDGKLLKDSLWPGKELNKIQINHQRKLMEMYIGADEEVPHAEWMSIENRNHVMTDGSFFYLLDDTVQKGLVALDKNLTPVKYYYYEGQPFRMWPDGVNGISGKLYFAKYVFKGIRGTFSGLYQSDR